MSVPIRLLHLVALTSIGLFVVIASISILAADLNNEHGQSELRKVAAEERAMEPSGPARSHHQQSPQNASDGFRSNSDSRLHKRRAESVRYEFTQLTSVRAVTVSWFEDTGSGECRLPSSWRLLYQAADDAWEPVDGVGEYPIDKSAPLKVAFTPVTAKALRPEVQLPPNFSAGLYEWEVE